jgi:hypothetical protein
MPACAQTGHAELVEAPGLRDPSPLSAPGTRAPSTKLGVNGIEPTWIDLLVAANDQNHCGPVRAETVRCRDGMIASVERARAARSSPEIWRRARVDGDNI